MMYTIHIKCWSNKLKYVLNLVDFVFFDFDCLTYVSLIKNMPAVYSREYQVKK